MRARRGAGSGHRPWAHALGVSAPRNAGTPRSRAGAGPAAPRFPAPGFTAGGRWSAAGKGLSRDTGSGQEPAAWDSPRSDEGEQQAPPGVTEGGLVPARALSALGTAETAARGPRARSPGRARIRSSRQRRRVRGAAPRQRPRRFGELSAPRSRVPQGSARPRQGATRDTPARAPACRRAPGRGARRARGRSDAPARLLRGRRTGPQRPPGKREGRAVPGLSPPWIRRAPGSAPAGAAGPGARPGRWRSTSPTGRARTAHTGSRR